MTAILILVYDSKVTFHRKNEPAQRQLHITIGSSKYFQIKAQSRISRLLLPMAGSFLVRDFLFFSGQTKSGRKINMENNTNKTRTVTSEICSWDELPLLLSSAQASKVLGYSTARVRELCNANMLPCIRVGRHFRIPKEALRQWIMTTSAQNIQDESTSLQSLANSIHRAGMVS